MEIDYGPFQRQVTLAEDIDPTSDRDVRARDPHGPPADRPQPAPRESVSIVVRTSGDRADRRDDRAAQDELTFPATLPVLPLKETVVFPASATPLAIGQERSIKLVEDVVSGDRLLALVAVRDPAVEQPGLGRSPRPSEQRR
jgi:hypothetical protein